MTFCTSADSEFHFALFITTAKDTTGRFTSVALGV